MTGQSHFVVLPAATLIAQPVPARVSIGKHLPAWDEKAMEIKERTWRNW